MMKIFEDQKFQKGFILAGGAVVTAPAILAIHDTVTATGAGYLLFLKTGMISRTGWDIIADLLVIILSLAFVIVPAIICKSGIEGAVLFYLANVSLTQLVRPDILITSFMGREGEGAEAALTKLTGYLPTLLIAFAVTLIIRIASGEEKLLSGKKVLYIVIPALFLGLSIPVSSMYEVFTFCTGYSVLLPAVGRMKDIKEGKLITAFVLILASIWRLYFVLATY